MIDASLPWAVYRRRIEDGVWQRHVISTHVSQAEAEVSAARIRRPDRAVMVMRTDVLPRECLTEWWPK